MMSVRILLFIFELRLATWPCNELRNNLIFPAAGNPNPSLDLRCGAGLVSACHRSCRFVAPSDGRPCAPSISFLQIVPTR
ncbi:hypothetical protein BJ138DRAFT_1144508 [Hygrophoropsis aurantiaca]|uniref:Uncharacterized protein n=1 Tax=Hygrophoropsis aurantiaca TaxID=72124 RepID=A0ACB8ALN8_9AGAM|nr:hypothetical protein BJ138DRAFT_1144508 [Hygrophoropsis aurantiaca]